MNAVSTATTRRTILGAGLLAIPAAVTAATLAAPAPAAPTLDSAEWDKAMAKWARTKKIRDAASEAFERAHEAYKAALPPTPDLRPLYPHHELHLLRTFDLSELEREARDLGVPLVTTRLRAIEDIRRYREAEQVINRRFDYDRLADLSEAADDEHYEAETRLMDLPAPNAAALLWKLEYALNTEDGHLNSYTAAHMAQTQADMRRLLGREV